MKRLSFSIVVALAGTAAFANIDHSQLINFPGAGTGTIAGADLSRIEAGENLFGWGAQTTASNTMADDFTVGAGGFMVSAIRVYLYQTGETAGPSITSVSWGIGAAPTTTLSNADPITANWWSPNGVGVYRLTATSMDNLRRIQEVRIDVADFMLAAGQHYLSFNAAGTGASGPWAPPIPTSLSTHGQNAMQSTAGGAFVPAFVDGVGLGGDMSFVIEGTAVPEPATMTILGLGALAAWRRRNKK